MMRPFLILSLLLLAGQAVRAQDWPTYRHDNRRSGVSSESLPETLQQVWTHRGGRPRQAWSGPAKWDAYSGNAGLQSMRNFDPCYYVTSSKGLVYYGSSHDNAVHALDLASGKERWVFFAEAPVRLPPLLDNETAYVGADDGYLYALDAATGDLRWKDRGSPRDKRIPSNASLISLWPVRSTPLLVNDTLIYTASLTPWESSWLIGVDPSSGKRRFTEELNEVTMQGAILATKERLIVPQGRSTPLLFDARTGKPSGIIKHAGGVFCLVTEDDQFLSGPNNQKPKDAQLHLTGPEGKKVATFNDTSRAVLSQGTAYLHSAGMLKAISYAEGTENKWTIPCDPPSELIVCKNAVLIGLKGAVHAYARDKGTLLWKAEVPGRVHGLALAGQTLLVSTDLGNIHAFRAP